MSAGKFSLTHLAREPQAAAGGPPPLLLMLHGIGSNEEDLLGLAPYLDGRLLVASARAPITMGPGAYGWFNIEFTPRGLLADTEQAKESLRMLPGFVGELVEAYGADAGRVYLMGFSQGAMMSLALALTEPGRIAGAVLMSGRYPSQALEQGPDARALAGKPFMVTHGLYDPVLPVSEGRAVRDQLEQLKVELTYREYPMGHEVSMESLKDVSAWLSRKLDGLEESGSS
jgi:phospholipase/carboxylesterase